MSIVSHRLSDADAYCSAYALASLFRKTVKGVKVEVGAPQGYTALAEKIRRDLGGEVSDKPDLHDTDLLVFVDTGDAPQLDEWLLEIKESEAWKVAIDHHPESPSIAAIVNRQVTFEDATSTSEIIYRLFLAKGVRPSRKDALAILLGIFCDSQSLRLASRETLRTVVDLTGRGASLEDVRSILSQVRSRSEVVARLKSAQRLKMFDLGGWLVCDTTIGSFHAVAAKSLLDLGADAGVAVGGVDGEVRGSLRATMRFCRETGVHLGKDVVEEVASLFNGSGGGHAGAASFTVSASAEVLRNRVLKIIAEKIGVELREIK